jgi:hypothetical protein
MKGTWPKENPPLGPVPFLYASITWYIFPIYK